MQNMVSNRVLNSNKPLVLCFHHAGGSVVAFKEWQKREDVEFLPIEFPHRKMSINQMSSIKREDFMNKIVERVYPLLRDRKFYVYGHSMGGRVGFELCVELERRHNLKASKLFVAGREAPHMPDLSPYKSDMGKDALVKELKRLGGTPQEIFDNKEILDYFLAVINSDYKLLESFRYEGEMVDVPIIAHAAEEDTEAGPEVMKYWNAVTNKEFSLERFEGSHFFLYDLGENYLEQLAEDIKKDFYNN